MPENIFKIYPPKKDPLKDGRRGSGLWSEDTKELRFKHVKRILDIYDSDDFFFDDYDLTWFLKNAVIGNIYFSETVVEGINKGLYWPLSKTNNDILKVIDAIKDGGTNTTDGAFDESLLQVRKWLGKQYHKDGAPALRFEHVIPAKIYLEKLKDLYNKGTNKFRDNNSIRLFEEYRKKIAVCIITEAQDKLLGGQLRESMPDDYEDFMKYPFARYDKSLGGAGIEIYGWSMQQGNLIKIP